MSPLEPVGEFSVIIHFQGSSPLALVCGAFPTLGCPCVYSFWYKYLIKEREI